MAAALLLIARWDGLTRADLGLDAAALSRGLRWASVLVGAILAVLLLGLALPAIREAFQDERAAGLTVGQLLWRVLIRVLFGTVLLEETAFRGVLWAMVRRGRGTAWATAVSLLLFGLRHVLPSRGRREPGLLHLLPGRRPIPDLVRVRALRPPRPRMITVLEERPHPTNQGCGTHGC